MPSRTESLIAKFIQNRKIYEYIGCGEISRNKLTQEKIDISELEPIVIEKRPDYYAVDFDLLSNVLGDFLEVFLPGIFTDKRTGEIIRRYLAGKTLCDIDEVELDKQSYKYLYKSLLKEYEDLTMEFHTQRYNLDECQREVASLNAELQNLKDSTSMYENSISDLMQFIRETLHKDIRVSTIHAVGGNGETIQVASDTISPVFSDDIAHYPAVYDFCRPSWFTKLRIELNKENASKKTAKNTFPYLERIQRFWEKLDAENQTPEEKADEVDRRRRDEIVKLLNDKSASNEEKYIKYILLTPGMSKDYMKTLNGASELGLSADIVIRMLEQPAESFNKEIVEAYISKVHKGLEYNLKQELAEELIRGEWAVRGTLNGREEIFQLVPYIRLQELADQFEKVYVALEKRSSSLSATMAQSEDGESGNFDQAWEKTLYEKALNQENRKVSEEDVEEIFEGDQQGYDEEDYFRDFDKEVL